MKVPEDFLPWNAVTSFETLFDLSGSLETCTLLPASWSVWPLSLHLHTSISAVIPPLSTLCTLPEQSLLHSRGKFSVSADTISFLSSVYWPTRHVSSQFHGFLKIKIVWVYRSFPRHPNPHFSPTCCILMFSSTQGRNLGIVLRSSSTSQDFGITGCLAVTCIYWLCF